MVELTYAILQCASAALLVSVGLSVWCSPHFIATALNFRDFAKRALEEKLGWGEKNIFATIFTQLLIVILCGVSSQDLIFFIVLFQVPVVGCVATWISGNTRSLDHSEITNKVALVYRAAVLVLGIICIMLCQAGGLTAVANYFAYLHTFTFGAGIIITLVFGLFSRQTNKRLNKPFSWSEFFLRTDNARLAFLCTLPSFGVTSILYFSGGSLPPESLQAVGVLLLDLISRLF